MQYCKEHPFLMRKRDYDVRELRKLVAPFATPWNFARQKLSQQFHLVASNSLLDGSRYAVHHRDERVLIHGIVNCDVRVPETFTNLLMRFLRFATKEVSHNRRCSALENSLDNKICKVGHYFIVGMTNELSSPPPSGQRAVIVLIFV